MSAPNTGFEKAMSDLDDCIKGVADLHAEVRLYREALARIAVATPASTNSATPKQMASWTRAVAETALSRGAQS